MEARLTTGSSEILMAATSGKCIRFPEHKVRPMGRNASGVRAINLENDSEEVIGMVCVNEGEGEILVVSENGYGKRSALDEYRVTNRGGKGVKTMNITEKTGGLIALKNVTDEDDLMIINKSGVMIRISVEEMRVMGRNTQGVRLINLKANDSIASITKVPSDDPQDDLNELDEGATDSSESSSENV